MLVPGNINMLKITKIPKVTKIVFLNLMIRCINLSKVASLTFFQKCQAFLKMS